MKSSLAISAALVIIAVSCQRHTNEHQQVQQFIAASEQMLEQENVDSAWALLDDAYRYASSHHYDAGKAEALLAMARHHNMMDRADSAISCLQRGLAAYPDAPDSLLAQYYGELSATYNVMGQMRPSADWAQQALPLMRRYGSNEDFAVICGNTGIAYRRLGNNDSAAICYREGLSVAIEASDYDSQAFLANCLSVLYTEMGRYAESIDYADKAAQAAIKAGDDVERLSAQANKGIALLRDKQVDKAVQTLTTTFAEADTTHSTPLKLKTINYLLSALTEAKRWKEVAEYLEKGEQLAAPLPPSSTASAGILEAKMNMLVETGRYTEALQTINQLEKLMQQQQVIPRHRLLARKSSCMAALGQWQEAYHLQAEAAALSDSLRNLENTGKLDRLTTDYRVMEKQLEVSRLSQQQAETQRSLVILLATLAILLAVIALLILWMRQRRQQTAMRATRKYLEGIEQERSRFARELHDGACNELLAIGMQLRAPQADIADVTTQIATLRAQLRNLSHELMPPQFADGVTLDAALRHYLSHLDSPDVAFRAEGTDWEQIPAQTAYQVYRIAQEAIGNIIVHQSEAHADVTLLYNNDESRMLQLNIVSHGTVMEGDGHGIGFQSMTERAESIGAALTTQHSGDTFTLKLNAPYGNP